MKTTKHQRHQARFKPITVAGFLFAGFGLGIGAILLGQMLLPALEGEDLTLSTALISAEILTSAVFTGIGFTCMVIGADPFEDSEFPFENPNDRETTV
ncbi:MAG: hypothetical protein KDA80_23870 [Planctomycetaceae bacterium]|nr:hypothetical protein [Planctomycetaceae bacterium]